MATNCRNFPQISYVGMCNTRSGKLYFESRNDPRELIQDMLSWKDVSPLIVLKKIKVHTTHMHDKPIIVNATISAAMLLPMTTYQPILYLIYHPTKKDQNRS